MTSEAHPVATPPSGRLHPLDIQCCVHCGAVQLLSRFACATCGSAELAWKRAAGGGIVWSATVVHRAPTPSFRALVPYAIAIVTLDEGARRMGHADPTLAIGERVRAGTFEHDGGLLLRFARADPQPAR